MIIQKCRTHGGGCFYRSTSLSRYTRSSDGGSTVPCACSSMHQEVMLVLLRGIKYPCNWRMNPPASCSRTSTFEIFSDVCLPDVTSDKQAQPLRSQAGYENNDTNGRTFRSRKSMYMVLELNLDLHIRSLSGVLMTIVTKYLNNTANPQTLLHKVQLLPLSCSSYMPPKPDPKSETQREATSQVGRSRVSFSSNAPKLVNSKRKCGSQFRMSRSSEDQSWPFHRGRRSVLHP